MNAPVTIHWNDRAEARALLAGLAPHGLHRMPRLAMFGPDYHEWTCFEEAPMFSIWQRLKQLRTEAISAITGHASFRDANACKDGGYWLRVEDRTPSLSDVVEMEFALREGRAPELRVRLDPKEEEAMRDLCGAGLPCKGAV